MNSTPPLARELASESAETCPQVGAAVVRRREELAAALVERAASRHPELAELYAKLGRNDTLEDADCHLSFLAQALALESRATFIDYVGWVKVMLAQRGVATSVLVLALQSLSQVLEERLGGHAGATAASFVEAALLSIPSLPDDLPSFFSPGAPHSPLAHQYFESVRRGERHLASKLVLDAVAAGTSVKDVYLHVFVPAQKEIGRLWQLNRISIAQEQYCTAVTQLVMSQLYPHVFASKKVGRTLVASSVAGDLHEIGIRMVADFFEMDGWSTSYLGANAPSTSVIAELVDCDADVLAVSATIPSHVQAVVDLIRAVRQDARCARVKILVGGYPFSRDPELWRAVGADGWAADAQQAVARATELTQRGAA